ncbi:uncharacterized protein [Onthophagus taurus]|uniref:uncharacterized protein isoform X1 n=1 Tax=Onthophagus taurus TaxID=166361 RepID=UPI0039BE69F2
MWSNVYLFRYILPIGFLLIIICENANGGDIYWREYNIDVPIDAVPAGHGLYVGQSILDGILTPGTIYPTAAKFVTEHYGKKEKTNDIKILCSQNPLRFKWEYIDVSNIPKNLVHRLVEGGYQSNLRWYIGRAFHQTEWRIGKVDLTGLKSLLIWNNDGTLQRLYDFEILTYV